MEMLYKGCIIIVIIMKLDDGDKNNVSVWLFLHSFNKNNMNTFSALSTALGAGDTEVTRQTRSPS